MVFGRDAVAAFRLAGFFFDEEGLADALERPRVEAPGLRALEERERFGEPLDSGLRGGDMAMQGKGAPGRARGGMSKCHIPPHNPQAVKPCSAPATTLPGWRPGLR